MTILFITYLGNWHRAYGWHCFTADTDVCSSVGYEFTSFGESVKYCAVLPLLKLVTFISLLIDKRDLRRLVIRRSSKPWFYTKYGCFKLTNRTISSIYQLLKFRRQRLNIVVCTNYTLSLFFARRSHECVTRHHQMLVVLFFLRYLFDLIEILWWSSRWSYWDTVEFHLFFLNLEIRLRV